jgi:hypothetical protein
MVKGVLWALLGVALLLGAVDRPAPAAPSEREIHIAFGFHVNLYHSFRNDTNDASGFGQDIRVIRHIIATLDRRNAQGVPVKAVWDFDNLFSLQEILPRHAPDIITDIQRRVRENGDEVILMSYNNGLVSAMTEPELSDAMRWAVTNPWQSGVRDLFGTYSPIVRPQEMMTTPGNFALYRKQGIQAVALYYSSTPFDAFRLFTRPLTMAEAHNPILYQDPKTDEAMVVIPTYHFGDLVEHVSLGNWVATLRRQQAEGKLANDALIFINYDADSELWEGIDLPRVLQWLPNTGGLDALIDEVCALPYVRFTTLNDYLAAHHPVGTFHFSQDTADGSFNGYNSWAEKADAPRHWTIIERSRRVRAAALKAAALLDHPREFDTIANLIAASDLKRMRALSTTHFGMATPFVAPGREQAMTDLMIDLERCSDAIEEGIAALLRESLARQPQRATTDDNLVWLENLMVLCTDAQTTGGGRFLKLHRPAAYREGMALMLIGDDGRRLPAVAVGGGNADGNTSRLALFIDGPELLRDGGYQLYARPRSAYPQDRLLRADAKGLANETLEVRLDGHGGIEGIYLEGVRQAEAGSLMPYVTHGAQTLCAQPASRRAALSADGRSAALRMTGPLAGPATQTLSAGWMDYRLTLLADRPYLLVHGRIRYPATVPSGVIKAGMAGLSRQADLGWQEVAPAEVRFAGRATPGDPIRVFKRNYLGVESTYSLDYFELDSRNRDLDNVNNHITAAYVGVAAGDRGMAVAMDTSIQSNFAFAPLKMIYDDASDTFQVRANPFGTYHGRQYRTPTWGNGHGYEMTLRTGEQFASAGPTYNGVAQEFSLLLAFFQGEQMPASLQQELLGFSHPPWVVSLSGPALPRPTAETLRASRSTEIDFAFDAADRPPRPDVPLGLQLRVLWANLPGLLAHPRL